MPNLLRASGPVLFRVLLNGLKGPIRFSLYVRDVLRVKMMRPCMFFRAIPQYCECESEILATQRPNMGHLMGRQLVVVCGIAVPGRRWRCASSRQGSYAGGHAVQSSVAPACGFLRAARVTSHAAARGAPSQTGAVLGGGAAAGVVQPVPKTPHFRGSRRR